MLSEQALADSGQSVKITAGGFEPHDITIQRGESVTWVNEDSEAHWPASNPHPIHTGYPSDSKGCIGSSFDACHGLVKGESYTFVFDKAGVWGAHDHLNPGMLMEIKVLDATEDPWWVRFEAGLEDTWASLSSWVGGIWSRVWYRQTQAPSLSDFRGMDMSNQTRVIKDLVGQDPEFAWKYLKDAYMQGGQVMGNAHSLAHVVGNVSYQHLGVAGVKICDTSFSYGCLHGVTEQLLRDRGPTAVADVEKECMNVLSGRAQDEVTGCIHGAGHGLLTWEGLNVGKALSDCDRLSYRWENYCYDGVFMENATDAPNWYSSSDSYWKLCSGLQTKYQYNCARYEAVGLSNAPNLNLRQIAKICEMAPVDTLTKPCLDSLGYKAAQDNLGSLDGIETECGGLSDNLSKDECLASAAVEVRFQHYSGWEKVSNELCTGVSNERGADCMKQAVAN